MSTALKSARATSSAVILHAAIEVFLRYGFRKCSMEDVASAAGLSRPGLYLHFASKDALFRAALQHIVAQALAGAESAATNRSLRIEERLLAIFEALHGRTMMLASQEHMNELLSSAYAMEPSLVSGLERSLIRIVARVLTEAGVADGWRKKGVSAKLLAEQLFYTANGIKESVSGLAAYRAKMRIAVLLMLGSRECGERS